MKLRISKSEIGLHIQKYLNKGYRKASVTRTQTSYSVTLVKEQESITIQYSNNGWLTIT